MAYKLMQFQQGMSLPEFLQSFGTEAACAEALRRARWPDGFVCPGCGSQAHCRVIGNGRSLYQCHACHRQTSLTAGTLFDNTKLPLTRWFLAIFLISQAKTGLSALDLKRHIGVSYPTAWLMHHKIMTAMAAQEAQRLLAGAVQVDDAYLGGERVGGKPGRGSENKVPIVAAVSLNDAGNPQYVKISPVASYSNEAISTWAKACLKPGSTVHSDGLACFAAVADAGCLHTPEVVGQRKPRDLPQFKWVNTVLGNLKTMLSGAYKAFGYAKYAQRYLGAFAYRFNQRFDLASLAVNLVVDVCRATATPKRIIRHAETRFESGREKRCHRCRPGNHVTRGQSNPRWRCDERPVACVYVEDAARGVQRGRYHCHHARPHGARWRGRAPRPRLCQLPDAELDTPQSLAEETRLVPKGVICLASALAFHALTDQMPPKVANSLSKPEDSGPAVAVAQRDLAYFGPVIIGLRISEGWKSAQRGFVQQQRP